MLCPKCREAKTVVRDSRVKCDGVLRLRECPACKRRFHTFERVDYRLELPRKPYRKRRKTDA